MGKPHYYRLHGGKFVVEYDNRQDGANHIHSVWRDVANDFAGCIAGCNEVLRRQGLMRGNWCLNPDEKLSPGQAAELDRIIAHYPHLCDDDFVAENLELWLG